jgi:RNA polymerase primary sigma factor
VEANRPRNGTAREVKMSEKLLTAEEEVALAKEIAAGNSDAEDKLVEANTRLVLKLANKYLNRGLSIDELVSAGKNGLRRAVKNFDWQRGNRFSPYACKCIWSHIKRAVEEQSSIHIPAYMVTRINQKKRASEELRQSLERNPTDEELAKHLGWTKGKLLTVRESENARNTVSLDTSNENGDWTGTFKDFLEAPTSSDPLDKVIFDCQRECLRSFFSKFPRRERQVAELRLGLTDKGDVPLLLPEIGKQLNIPKRQVWQIERRISRRLNDPRMRQRYEEILAD